MEYLELLRKILTADRRLADKLCSEIIDTPLIIPILTESLAAALRSYYSAVAAEYCQYRSTASRNKLEKVIQELNQLLSL